MAGRVLVDDELWAIVEPLMPKVKRRRVRPGRRRLDDRAVLNGILFVLHTGIPWRLLPQELGFGSGVTCWRRLREWQQAGMWERLHDELLIQLNRAGEIDWDRAVIDSSHIRALLGGSTPGHPRLTVPARGSKHHVLTDASGIPLSVSLTGGNRNDVTQLLPLIDAVKPIRGRVGRPRKRPKQLIADRGYDHDKYRRELWKRGVKPVIGRRATEHGSGLGKQRWVVEAAVNFLHQFRRLRIRWERDPEMHVAFLYLACALICWRRLSAS